MKKINLNFRVFIVFFLFLNFLLFSKNDNATEILIYADEITYDSEKNITAKNNAKIIWGNQIITSDIIIYNNPVHHNTLIESGLKLIYSRDHWHANGRVNYYSCSVIAND